MFLRRSTSLIVTMIENIVEKLGKCFLARTVVGAPVALNDGVYSLSVIPLSGKWDGTPIGPVFSSKAPYPAPQPNLAWEVYVLDGRLEVNRLVNIDRHGNEMVLCKSTRKRYKEQMAERARTGKTILLKSPDEIFDRLERDAPDPPTGHKQYGFE